MKSTSTDDTMDSKQNENEADKQCDIIKAE